MLLHNSKVVNQSSTLQNASTSILFNARQDDEDAHCFVSSDGINASSVTLTGECVADGLLSAECLSPITNHGRRKWSHDKNLELMRCYSLVKCDGRGYHDRLKSIWDARNPSKTSLSVNVLACHSRNIQTAKMLTPYELKALRESSSPNVLVDDVQLLSDVL